MRKWRVGLWVAASLVVLDLVAATCFSGTVSRRMLEAANRYSSSRISFENVRIHPLFLSVSAERFEVFDAERPDIRILYARRVHGRWDLLALLRGQFFLASARFDSCELRIIKDMRGVFNFEKMLLPETDVDRVLYGWKHKDMLFNFYERLKHAVSPRSGFQSQKNAPERRLLFRIGKASFRNGRVILTDRHSKPLLFDQVRIAAGAVEWHSPEGVSIDSLSVQGLFKAAVNGPFSLTLHRAAGRIRVVAVASNIDVAALRALYQSSSPVLFERGILSLRSETVMSADKISSRNELRFTEFQMKPTVTWSPGSQMVLNALNTHQELVLRFRAEGSPSRPVFVGMEESLMDILKQNFDPGALALIRRRVVIEVETLQARFA